MVTGCINLPEPVKMPLLYLEKKPDYWALKDYFQSQEYLTTQNMLLPNAAEPYTPRESF
jgi:hypothetical protein